MSVSRKIKPAAFALLIFALAACAPAATPTAAPTQAPTAAPTAAVIELQDGRGVVVRLEKPAERIVSLAPSNTEILFALGAGDRVVGRDTFSDFPQEALAVTDIGGDFGELNMEVILAQQPDLVLASSLTAVEQIQALEDAGLTVFNVPNPTDFDGLYANLHSLALMTGREAQARALADDMRARVTAVQQKVGAVSERPLVFYEIDGTDPNAPWTPGPGSYMDLLINMAGGRNTGADLQGAWVQISLEELIARAPDIILLGDTQWGTVTVESASARSGWEALEAVRSGRIHAFDDNLVSRPGPRLVQGLEELAKILHPELFQ